MKSRTEFFGPWLLGLALGAAFVVGATFLPLACATVTDPPPGWPKDPTCAQDPSGPTCYPPVHDEKRDR